MWNKWKNGFAGHLVSVTSNQLYCCKSSHWKTNEHGCVLKALFKDMEIWISYIFHMSQNTDFSPQPYKNIKCSPKTHGPWFVNSCSTSHHFGAVGFFWEVRSSYVFTSKLPFTGIRKARGKKEWKSYLWNLNDCWGLKLCGSIMQLFKCLFWPIYEIKNSFRKDDYL